VRDGDSGAWVVHSHSPEVYGHVVATDLFGDAYVVPILDTFHEIKDIMGAAHVSLPAAEDFRVELRQNRLLTTNGPATCPPRQFARIDDVGSETSDSTLVADVIDSIISSPGKSPDLSATPWITPPPQILHKAKSKGSTNVSRGSDQWSQVYARTIGLDQPKRQDATEPHALDQHSTRRTVDKRKSSKQKSHEQKSSLQRPLEHNEHKSKMPKMRRSKKTPRSFTEQGESISLETAEPKYHRNASIKEWPRKFSIAKPRGTEKIFVDIVRRLNPGADAIDLVFQDCNSSGALWIVNEVQDFCKDASFESLSSGRGAAGSMRAAWLDDRSISTKGAVRRYNNPLTATALYNMLKQSVGTCSTLINNILTFGLGI
jgi:hypothetical protein